MQKLIDLLRKPAKWVVIGGLAAYFLFIFITQIGMMANADPVYILQALLSLAANGILIAALIMAMLLGKKEVARLIGGGLAIYAIISGAISFNLVSMAAAVLHIFGVISLLMTVVLTLLLLFKPNIQRAGLLRLLTLAGVAGYCAFSIAVFIAAMVEAGQDGSPWFVFLDYVAVYLILPISLFFGFLLLQPIEEGEVNTPAEQEPETEEPAEEKEPEVPDAKPEEEPKAEEPEEPKGEEEAPEGEDK